MNFWYSSFCLKSRSFCFRVYFNLSLKSASIFWPASFLWLVSLKLSLSITFSASEYKSPKIWSNSYLSSIYSLLVESASFPLYESYIEFRVDYFLFIDSFSTFSSTAFFFFIGAPPFKSTYASKSFIFLGSTSFKNDCEYSMFPLIKSFITKIELRNFPRYNLLSNSLCLLSNIYMTNLFGFINSLSSS